MGMDLMQFVKTRWKILLVLAAGGGFLLWRKYRGKMFGELASPPDEHLQRLQGLARRIEGISGHLDQAIDDGECHKALDYLRNAEEWIGAYGAEYEGAGEAVHDMPSPDELREAIGNTTRDLSMSCIRERGATRSAPRSEGSLHRERIPRPAAGRTRMTPEERTAAYLADRANGMTIQQMATKYGTSHGAVSRVLAAAKQRGSYSGGRRVVSSRPHVQEEAPPEPPEFPPLPTDE